MKQYVIVCDESTKLGNKFSYFYGGAIIEESKYFAISQKLELFKNYLGLKSELKRIHIDAENCNRYIDMLDFFFTFVKSGDIKLRVMFSKNDELDIIPKTENETYMKFYYLFIRYSFALSYAQEDIDLRLIFDDLPEKPERREKFKKYLISNLMHIPDIDIKNNISLKRDRIEEVNSEKHIILQYVDVIVGLIDFLMNNADDSSKGKRWHARNKVLSVLLSYIYELNPNFVMEKTTSPTRGYICWRTPYRHFIYKKSATKKAPAFPT